MAGDEWAAPEAKSWLYQPTFPEHWERRPLYSLARWVNGLAFRDIQFSEFGKPVIKIAEIKGGISGQTKFTTQVFDEAVHVRVGDLLFSWSGQPETSIDVFWWRGPDGWLNQHSFRVTPREGIDPTFFFYLLRYLKPSFVGIARNKQTTGLGHVTKRDLENIEAAYPALPEQRAIAHILGTLDDMIELNRRMNATLEAMSRALFKSWFVDFDPVRAKADGRDPNLPKPLADLFPARLVDSDLGEIPEGWRASVLGEELTRCGGRIQTGPFGSQLHASDYVADGVPVVMPKDLSRRRVSTLSIARVNINDAERLSRHRLQRGDIVYSRRGDVEQHGLVHRRETGWLCGTGCLLVRPGPEWPSPLWVSIALDRPESRAWIVQHAIGATMPNLNTGILARVPLVVPPDEILWAFDQFARPLADKVISADAQTAALVSLRDALLPKLISGEIRVTDSASTVETC